MGTCQDSFIDFGIQAQYAGIHKMVLMFKGVQITVEETFAIGEQIKFPTAALNENYTFTGNLYDPNGEKIIILKDAVQYDCIEFKTALKYVA